jgi:hypothetical protein
MESDASIIADTLFQNFSERFTRQARERGAETVMHAACTYPKMKLVPLPQEVGDDDLHVPRGRHGDR